MHHKSTVAEGGCSHPRPDTGEKDDGTTGAINRAIAGLPADHAFTDAAAAALFAGDPR
jgi:hypothetical protein